MAYQLCKLAFDDPGVKLFSEDIKEAKRTLLTAFDSSGLSQVDVALKLGITPSSLSRSLSEKHSFYCIELTEDLCDLLKIEFKDSIQKLSEEQMPVKSLFADITSGTFEPPTDTQITLEEMGGLLFQQLTELLETAVIDPDEINELKARIRGLRP